MTAKTVYVSGKITGLPYNEAYKKFAQDEECLLQLGYKVLNPMRFCRMGWSWRRSMTKCVWKLLFADYIYLQRDWRNSRGSRIECAIAKTLGKKKDALLWSIMRC